MDNLRKGIVRGITYESRHRTRTMTMTRLDVVHGSSSVLLDSTQLRLCKMRARVRIVSCRKRGPCTILPPKCAWRERASESESEVRGQRPASRQSSHVRRVRPSVRFCSRRTHVFLVRRSWQKKKARVRSFVFGPRPRSSM